MYLYNVWHHRLFDELLEDLSEEDKKAIVCFGVNEFYAKEFNPEFGYNIMYEYDLPLYESIWQRQGYCQTTCMYHVYNNRDSLIKQASTQSSSMNYIGFMQYDMKVDKDAFAYWENRITSMGEGSRIIFHELTIPTYSAFSQDRALETHTLKHYNSFFGTNLTVQEITTHPKCQRIPVVHTFIIPIDMFNKMMSWMTVYMRYVEENKEKTGDYPFHMSQAEFFERVHGIFLAIECMQDNTCMEPITKLRHVWPLFHNKTRFDNYKVQTK
jgi:uncharacterized short protein YbdD (DUF466 family)